MTTKEPGAIEGEAITDSHGDPGNQGRTPGGLFSKGASGNPLGRPLGSHNKSTLLARSKFVEMSGAIADKAIEVALAGHPLALKLCLERILPRPRDPDAAVTLDLPSIATVADCAGALDTILASIVNGDITPNQGETLTRVIESRMRSFEMVVVEQRVSAIEQAIARLPVTNQRGRL